MKIDFKDECYVSRAVFVTTNGSCFVKHFNENHLNKHALRDTQKKLTRRSFC